MQSPVVRLVVHYVQQLNMPITSTMLLLYYDWNQHKRESVLYAHRWSVDHRFVRGVKKIKIDHRSERLRVSWAEPASRGRRKPSILNVAGA